jgi:carbon storage regulator
MLIIRRKAGESLLIGPDVEIEVIDVSASRVKLGIRAPREVVILRKEVRLAAEQNLAASRGLSADRLQSLVASLHRTRPAGGARLA